MPEEFSAVSRRQKSAFEKGEEDDCRRQQIQVVYADGLRFNAAIIRSVAL